MAFGELGGRAQWAPNEKVALEVGLGAAFAGARALVTMKHVGVNVAADPLFTVVVNPETDGRHSIVESNYNNNSFTLKLSEHTDWGRKCP